MIDADDALSLIENNKMENPNNVQIVAFANDGILIDDTKDFAEKGEDIKTTEYFLDVGEEHMEEENVDEQFVTIENSCKDGEEQFITVGIEDTAGAILDDKEVILWNELCRICANGSDRFIPIFTDEGLEHELSNKIHTYLPLEVSETDTLPHQLCYNCAATLLAWHEMIKGCLDAQQRLEEMHNKFQLKDQYYNDSANEEENIQAVSEIEMTNNEEANDQNKEVQNMETVQIVEATDSDREFSPRGGSHEDRESPENHNFVYMCGVCDEFYESEYDLLDHINNDHLELLCRNTLNPLRYECHKCLKTYVHKSNLIRHMEGHSIELPGEDGIVENCKTFQKRILAFKCDDCGHTLSNRRAFIRHVRMHANERPVVCDVCGKTYRIEDDLKRHMNDVHRKIKRFPCDICGTPFAAKTTRDAHRRIHTGEKPFTCEECGKTFRSINLLGVHKRIHTDYRPFKCSYCEKAFRNRQKLTIHECIHTGIKPYPCDICQKMFSAKGEAMRHRSVHFRDKPFLCSECGLSFRLNRYLRTHIKQHHGDQAQEMLNAM